MLLYADLGESSCGKRRFELFVPSEDDGDAENDEDDTDDLFEPALRIGRRTEPLDRFLTQERDDEKEKAHPDDIREKVEKAF